jgi:hypothetical protein
MLCETENAVADTPEILQQARKERRKEYLKEYRALNTEKKKAYNRSYYNARKAYARTYYAANIDKFAARKKIYYEANIDKVAANQKIYYEANIDKIKARQKIYYEANVDKYQAYNQTYYAANIDKVTAYNPSWREKNADKIRSWREKNADKITQYRREKNGCVDCKDWPDWQYGSKRYDGRCPRCHEHKFPDDPRLRAEYIVRAYINANFKDFVHDHTMPTAHCDCNHLRRIDHRCVVGNTLLCIETDEHYHRNYKKDDEDARYHDVMLPWGLLNQIHGERCAREHMQSNGK